MSVIGVLSFYASAAVALVAALIAVSARQPRRSLGAFAIALVALVVPLVQLRAPMVAALVLLASAVIVALLGALVGLRGPGAESGAGGGARASMAFWVPASLGLIGFVWVLLATGSRQVVEFAPPLEPGAAFGDGSAVLMELGADHFVPALVVGLLALCSVIAAVLTLVGERDPGADRQPSSTSA